MSNETWILIISIAVGVVAILGLILFIFTNRKLKVRLKHYKKTDSRSLIFVINLETKEVIYFNRKTINNKIHSNLSNFLTLYEDRQSNKISEWLNAIEEDSENVEKHLDVVTRVSDKKTRITLLSLKKYIKKKRTVYLEAKLLMNLGNVVDTKIKRTDKKYFSISKNDLQPIYDKHTKNCGYVFAIKFFPKNVEVFSGDEMPKNIMMVLKNALCIYVKGKTHYRYFVNEKDNRICIFDFKISKTTDSFDFSDKLSRTIGSCLKTNGYFDSCGYSIGIAQISDFICNMNGVIDASKEASDIAQNNSYPSYLYEIEKTVNFEHAFNKSHVEELFLPMTIRYLFRPIINTDKLNVFGYFSYVRTFDGKFNSYSEMVDATYKVERNKELFTKIARATLYRFANRRDVLDTKLFLSVSLIDLEYMTKILNDIPSRSGLNIVLTFEESELNANSMSQDILLRELSDLNAQGYELALLMKDEDLLLNPDVYYNFSYFVLGSALVSKVRVSNRIKLSNRFLVEQLMQFKRPIIATDLDGWPSVELFVKSGIKYISCNDISPASESFTPIDKRKYTKIESYLLNE